MTTVSEAIAALDAERERIWLTCPEEIERLGQGHVPRRTGSHGQYFTTLMFAEGESRTLSDELLWGLIEIGQKTDFDLRTVVLIVDQIVSYKAAFFDFVGMPEAGKFLQLYVEGARAATSQEEFLQLTRAAITYVNKVHMWVDAVFPWGVSNAFKRAS